MALHVPHPVRSGTAPVLFHGRRDTSHSTSHDTSADVMRRIPRTRGAEVIHLGHRADSTTIGERR